MSRTISSVAVSRDSGAMPFIDQSRKSVRSRTQTFCVPRKMRPARACVTASVRHEPSSNCRNCSRGWPRTSCRDHSKSCSAMRFHRAMRPSEPMTKAASGSSSRSMSNHDRIVSPERVREPDHKARRMKRLGVSPNDYSFRPARNVAHHVARYKNACRVAHAVDRALARSVPQGHAHARERQLCDIAS